MRLPTTQNSLSRLVGAPAAIAYTELIQAHSDVMVVTACHYKSPALLQQRLKLSDFEQQLFSKAMKIRKETQIPFWQALFSACLLMGRTTDTLVDAAVFHKGPGQLTPIPIERLREGFLCELVKEPNANVGIASAIEIANSEQHHLALLDLHCRVSERNTELVAAVCRRLMPEGYLLLDSGESYHVCGLGLRNAQERVQLLAMSLFFSPIVDSTYVAHQLLQPISSIRISVYESRKSPPKVLLVEQPAKQRIHV